MEQKKCYCVWCGAENTAEAPQCRSCGRTADPREHLLIDYLAKHTKDSLKDKAVDSVYSAIKNYLLSHLYGLVVTLAVVLTAAAVIYSNEPYIERVNSRPSQLSEISPAASGTVSEVPPLTIAETVPESVQTEISSPISDDDFDILLRQANDYMVAVDLAASAGEAAMSQGIGTPDSYRLPEELGYSGTHQVQSSATVVGDTIVRSVDTIFTDTILTPAEPRTELGAQLVQDGYEIAELSVQRKSYAEDPPGSNAVPLLTENILLILAKVDGTWYVAEDLIIN